MSQLSLDLLAQATTLATIDPLRPKEANLRRAVSTAYYALFHHLVDSAAQFVAGTQAKDWPLAALTARAFAHSDMRAACRAFQNAQPSELLRPLWAQYRPHTNADLTRVAGDFVALQESRHAADYDLTLRLFRADVLDTVDVAGEAIAAWERLRQNERELARLVALVMLLWKLLQHR